MKFNIEDYKNDKYVMHCKTKEEAKSFCNYLQNIGKKWCNGDSYNNTKYNVYGEATCYDFILGDIGLIDFYKQQAFSILEWSDFMEDTVENTSESENKDITKFSKYDLQTGDIVLRRNNTSAIFIKEFNTLVSSTGYSPLEDYTDDLRINLGNNDYDIIKVRRPLCPSDVQFKAFNYDFGKLVFDRGYVKEMTLEEIEKELGYKIRIKADVQ